MNFFRCRFSWQIFCCVQFSSWMAITYIGCTSPKLTSGVYQSLLRSSSRATWLGSATKILVLYGQKSSIFLQLKLLNPIQPPYAQWKTPLRVGKMLTEPRSSSRATWLGSASNMVQDIARLSLNLSCWTQHCSDIPSGKGEGGSVKCWIYSDGCEMVKCRGLMGSATLFITTTAGEDWN